MKRAGKLSHIPIHRREIPVGDASFAVRALNLSDILTMAAEHLPAMTKTYKQAFEHLRSAEDLDAAFFKTILTDTLKEFPAFVPALISQAADDSTPEGFEVARTLPFVTQLEAVEAIVALTLASEGELKKLMEIAANLLERVNAALLTARSEVSVNGNGSFVSE